MSGISSITDLAVLFGKVPGIEAVFVDDKHVFCIAREHSDVDWESLITVEDYIVERIEDIQVSVRAHQGRSFGSMTELDRAERVI
jgi:hypothetical protein